MWVYIVLQLCTTTTTTIRAHQQYLSPREGEDHLKSWWLFQKASVFSLLFSKKKLLPPLSLFCICESSLEGKAKEKQLSLFLLLLLLLCLGFATRAVKGKIHKEKTGRKEGRKSRGKQNSLEHSESCSSPPWKICNISHLSSIPPSPPWACLSLALSPIVYLNS